jgi:NADH:ubiquinone oxidoreductase subunit K
MQFLNKPYPIDFSPSLRWKMTLLFSLFVFLFLLIFQPFGLKSFPGNIFIVALGYGFICFSIMLICNFVLPYFFPKFFDEEQWTTAKELIFNGLNIFSIAIANGFYTVILGFEMLNVQTFAIFLFYTMAVAVFPISIYILINQFKLNQKFEIKSIELNQSLSKELNIRKTENISDSEIKQITLSSENQKEAITLNVTDLLFLQSSENYVEVHYLKNQIPTKSLIRNSLKQLEIDLHNFPQIFRCHKSFMVNKNRISFFSGNAQGYKLHLKETDLRIPVSRKLNDKLQDMFTIHP